MAADLPARLGRPLDLPQVALGPVPFAALRAEGGTLARRPRAPLARGLRAPRRPRGAPRGRSSPASPTTRPSPTLDVAAPSEAALLARLTDTARPFDETPVPARIAAQAARTPRRPRASRPATGTLTYADLVAEAEALAGSLRALGAGPGRARGRLPAAQRGARGRRPRGPDDGRGLRAARPRLSGRPPRPLPRGFARPRWS